MLVMVGQAKQHRLELARLFTHVDQFAYQTREVILTGLQRLGECGTPFHPLGHLGHLVAVTGAAMSGFALQQLSKVEARVERRPQSLAHAGCLSDIDPCHLRVCPFAPFARRLIMLADSGLADSGLADSGFFSVVARVEVSCKAPGFIPTQGLKCVWICSAGAHLPS